MSTDYISVLSHSTAYATKRWHLSSGGKAVCEDYGNGKNFCLDTFPCDGIATLSNLLAQLTECPLAFVIRGEPLPGRDTKSILRRHRTRKGEPPGFRETPRRWMCVDADKILTAEEVGDVARLLSSEGCEELVYQALGKLPFELRDVACFWQLSSSAGMKPGLSMHFWFWLDRPMGETELTRWAEAVNDAAGRKLVDPATLRTVQPNYIADPVFDGVNNPVGKRWGFLEGPNKEASLPKLTARADAWLRKLDPLKDPKTQEIHPHVRNACASYFCARGPNDPAPNLLGALRKHVDAAIDLRGEDRDATIYTDEKLSEYIESGRTFAKDRAAQGENLACDQNGVPKPVLANVRALLTSSPEWQNVLAYNERKDRAVLLAEPPFQDGYKGNRSARVFPRDWTDTDDSRLVSWLSDKFGLHVFKSLATEAIDLLARENSFDPVVDYLTALDWDGIQRLDTWMIDYLGVADSRYSRRAGAMWCIAAVARAMQPGCKADCVLSLEGEQGKRKSTALEVLAGGPEYFREGIGDIRAKDTWMAMQSAWIIELRELANFSSRESEAQKGFLDKRNDHYRGSYDRRPSDHYRRCVFAATTNRLSYLNDETGARRWWPVLVGRIDVAGLATARDQLWAEAVHRFRAGEHWWVEASDPDFVAQQEARYDGDEREDEIAGILETGKCHDFFKIDKTIPPIPAKAESVTMVQVLAHCWGLDAAKRDRRAQRDMSKILTHLGWQRKHTRTGKQWVR